MNMDFLQFIFNDGNYSRVKEVLMNTAAVIRTDETFEHYFDICEVVYKMNPEQFIKHSAPQENHYRYELEVCDYWFLYKKRNVVHIDCKITDKDSSSWKILVIEIFGADRDRIRRSIVNRINRIIHGNGKTCFYFPSDNVTYEDTTPSRTFDSICLPDGIKEKLITNLYSWYNSTDWYNEHGLIHKIGVLLHGKPGTGKSSIIRAISKMFNSCPIVPLRINQGSGDFFWEMQRLRDFRKRRDGVFIVLFEDIDLSFKKDKKGNIIQEGPSQMLYQILDGAYAMDGVIYIATTNHIERLDEGLIRYGRFDIQIELPYFTREKMYEFGKMFDYSKEEIDAMVSEEDCDEHGCIQPALLQSKFMEDRSKKAVTKYIKERSDH